MTDKIERDGFRATRIHGGTEVAERVLAWAGTELVRRQQDPRDGDDAQRERWDEVLVIFVEEFEQLSERGRAQVERLAREGRPDGIVISVRTGSRSTRRDHDWVLIPPAQRFDPPLEPMTVEQARTLVAAIMAEIEHRNGKKRGRR